MPSRHLLTVVLGSLLLVALAVVGWQTDWGRTWRGTTANATPNKAASFDTKILPAFALAPLSPSGSGYRETVERPLFVPTRRPAPAGSGAQGSMKKGQFRLAGTTVSEQLSVAYLFDPSANKTHRVNKGADFNGMTVESVTTNRVVLRQGDDTEELVLRTSTSPPRPPPAPQMAGAPGGSAVAAASEAAASMGSPPIAMPGASPPFPPGFGPGVSPGAGSAAAAPSPPPVAPLARAPAVQNTDPTAQTAQDPNQSPQRRRRFQNLPQ